MSAENPARSDAPAPTPAPTDFIRDLVAQDVAAQRYPQIVTRFPPEPNGYLHIGHAKSICLNFGLARENQGRCHLRFDDTNPVKEDVEYVEAIAADVRWLVAGWADHCLGYKPKGAHPAAQTVAGKNDFYLASVAPSAAAEPFFASDYFEALYGYAVELIKRGLAYVCDLSPEDTDAYRGSPDKPGRNSPFRDRSVAENLDLFARMRAGEFPNGARSLRAKIDMASPNIWLRSPALPHPPHAPPPRRRQVVHLSALRFRPLPQRLSRGHHPQRLHPRIRGAPPALRLDPRVPRTPARPPPPIRIRQAQHQLDGLQQAPPPPVG